jgi:hypothetical protein
MAKRKLFEAEFNDDKSLDAEIKQGEADIANGEDQLKIDKLDFQTASKLRQTPGKGPNLASRMEDKKSYAPLMKKAIEAQKFHNDELARQKERVKNLKLTKTKKESGDVNAETEAALTQEQILRMVETVEPARMKKKDLIESITKNILKEDMNDNIKDKIDSGDNDYARHLDPETVKRMASDIMDGIKANLEAKMGGRGRGRIDMDAAQRVLSQGLVPALQKEQNHKPELERLAVQLVCQEYDIPEDAVDFDAKITGHPQMGGTEIRKTGLKMTKGNKRPPQGKTEEELKPNITKRRLMNAMMHGAARKGQYMYHMAQDQLNQIAPGLAQDYSNIMAGNDFMYWGLDDETISQESEGGQHAGQVRVDLSGPKPKIIAQGMTFPFLLHELTKGVLELMSLHGLDVDKETRDYVLDKTDNLESEPWDIRLGPKIWEKFMEALDTDDLPYKSHIFNRLSTLPPAEFNSIVQGLLNDAEQARNAVREMADEVRSELNQEEVDTSLSQFSDKGNEGGDDENPETPEGGDDEDPVLKGLLGNDKPQEDVVDDPNTLSKRELEDARDEALDNEDYKAVAYIQSILDKKFR